MKTKRIISLLLVLSMLICLHIPVGAAYENTYSNTGNQAADIIGVAKTQVGYAEGSNNYTKYGVWYGSSNVAWCAVFISWCANQANVPTSILPKFASCTTGQDWFKSKSRWKTGSYYGGSYTPKIGDIVFYDWDVDGSPDHVGLVESVSSTAINTIEGNYSDKVSRRTSVSRSSKNILGYGNPNYNASVVIQSQATGKYQIKADPYLNIRSGMGTNYGTIGQIPNGEIITVTSVSNGWGKVTYGGVTGYISLDYATLVTADIASISVTTKPTKTEYKIGESFSTSGMVVKATYTDGSTKAVTGYSVTGFSSTSAGTKTITVTYSGKTTTFTVTVVKDYTTGTYKIKADGGLNLRTGAGSSYGVYTTIPNGTTVNVTKISGTWGQVTYNSYTGWVSMEYLEETTQKTLSSIKISSKPAKVSYYVGDTADKTGLVVTATYSDGSTADVTSSASISGFSTTSAGTKTVTVTYSGKTATFTITVTEPTITLSSSKLSMYDTQTTTLTATTKPASQTVTWSSSATNVVKVTNGLLTAIKEGSSTITASFTYNGKKYSAKCTVTVGARNVKSIAVKTLPKTDYTDGESLSTKGLVLTVTYNEGSSTTISSGYTVSGFDTNKIGTQTITVKYMGKSTTYNVNVRADFVPFRTIEYNGHIYSLYDEDLTYTQAAAKCEVMGGKLVTITSAQEQQVIYNALLGGKDNKYWIGLTDRNGKSGEYNWETGEKVDYTNWIPAQPNAKSGQNAAIIQMAYDGKWNDVSVDYDGEIGFICEIDANNIKYTEAKTYNNKTYYRFDKQMTWNDAKAFSEMLGGHLVTITSSDEFNTVKTLASGGKADSYWLGATDVDSKGTFTWVTGEKFSYNNWITNNPDNANSCEHFAEMSKSDSYKWNDVKSVGRDGCVTGFIVEVESFTVKLDIADVSMVKGQTTQLKATVSGGIYSANDVKWSSTDTSVVKVSSSGLVTAVSSGSAGIIAEIGGVATYCMVTVIGKD